MNNEKYQELKKHDYSVLQNNPAKTLFILFINLS